jgi:hypothetical protein
MTLEEAWTTAHAILSDMEGVSGRTPAYTVRRWATRLGEALRVIDDAGAELSAGVCDHKRGNEHGNAFCVRDGKLI